MDISTIKSNIRQTIAGKEMLLDTYKNADMKAYPEIVRNVMIQALTHNIAELSKILADLENVT
jgi:hypothetical protein